MIVKEQIGNETVSSVVIRNIAALSRLAEFAGKSVKECALRARADDEKQKHNPTSPKTQTNRLSPESRYKWLNIVSDIRTMDGKQVCVCVCVCAHCADNGRSDIAAQRKEHIKLAIEQVKHMLAQETVVRAEKA